MATNIDPIFTGTPDWQWGSAVTAVNTAMDGTGTVTTIFTADATNGGFCGEIGLKPLGTNVPSVARFFINNGLTNATAANNALIDEVTLPATTSSATAALIRLALPIQDAMKAGHRILMTIGTAVAAGWIANAKGGSYTKG
jgi:hypothetical protein